MNACVREREKDSGVEVTIRRKRATVRSTIYNQIGCISVRV